MAGAFMPRGVVGFDPFPENSMVRGLGTGTAVPYNPAQPAYVAPMVGQQVATQFATNQYAPQPMGMAQPASSSSNSILDAINKAYDMQSKLAAEAAGVQWSDQAGDRGLLPGDQAGQGLRAELVGKAMNPIAVSRASAIANAMMEQQRMENQQKQWEQDYNMRAAEFNARNQGGGSASGSYSYSTPGGGSATTYGSRGVSAPTSAALPQGGGSAGERLAYSLGMMDSPGSGGGGGGRSAGFEGSPSGGIPGLTPGVGGVSDIFGSASFNSFSQGFGQRNGGFGTDTGIFRQPGQSYSAGQLQADRSQTTFSGAGAVGAPIPGGAKLQANQYTGTGQGFAGPSVTSPLVSGGVRADTWNQPQTFASATGYTPYGQKSPYAAATGRA